MNKRRPGRPSTAVTELINGSASWKIFGQRLHAPLPTAHIARNMRLSRQAVQRLANEMERDDLVRFAPNPHHERAKFVAGAFRIAQSDPKRTSRRKLERTLRGSGDFFTEQSIGFASAIARMWGRCRAYRRRPSAFCFTAHQGCDREAMNDHV